MLRLPISPAITASFTVSRCVVENDAASKGVAAIHAIGHYGWRLVAIENMTPEPMLPQDASATCQGEGIVIA